MGRLKQLALVCGVTVPVIAAFFLFPLKIEAESEAPVNKDYFQAIASELFGDAITGLQDAPYAELKSAYSSDYRGAARVPLTGLESMPFREMDPGTLSDYTSIQANFPDIATVHLGMPDGLLILPLPNGQGDALLYRFLKANSAMLIIQDY